MDVYTKLGNTELDNGNNSPSMAAVTASSPTTGIALACMNAGTNDTGLYPAGCQNQPCVAGRSCLGVLANVLGLSGPTAPSLCSAV